MWAPTPLMIMLGLFLLYLAATGATFGSIEWLVRWFSGATMTEAALTFSAVLGAVASILVLAAYQRWGVIVAVAVIVFWSLVIFGARGTTAINIIELAAATLVVAAAVVLVQSFMARRRRPESRPEQPAASPTPGPRASRPPAPPPVTAPAAPSRSRQCGQ
jgi:hypothetical protein